MTTVQVRDVPDEVRDMLARRARQRGQSLQAYLLDVITAEALRARNIEVLYEVAHTGGGTRDAGAEIADLVASERRSRS
jgi:hypothetical protein